MSTDAFIAALAASLEDGSFCKLSLGGYRGPEGALKSAHIRRVVIKGADHLGFTFRYKTRDIVKNHPVADGVAVIATALDGDFTAATLMTTAFDLHFPAMKRGKPTHTQTPATGHDRDKNRPLATTGQTWLYDLNITDAGGRVLKAAQDKFRQINHYIDLLKPHLQSLPRDRAVRIADMGSGKGYLTFALYDYLTNTLNVATEITGVEYRADLVALCNDVAARAGFSGLRFVQGSIADAAPTSLDMLVALHACDTATDDALAAGIKAEARLIVVAPCCHKQIRRAMHDGDGAAEALDPLLKHGIFAERQAEMVTDSLRALVLEHKGYKTKVLEFISDAHTPKNVMIVAEQGGGDRQAMDKIRALCAHFGIGRPYLEKILEPQS